MAKPVDMQALTSILATVGQTPLKKQDFGSK
jgi:hypothetical protein